MCSFCASENDRVSATKSKPWIGKLNRYARKRIGKTLCSIPFYKNVSRTSRVQRWNTKSTSISDVLVSWRDALGKFLFLGKKFKNFGKFFWVTFLGNFKLNLVKNRKLIILGTFSIKFNWIFKSVYFVTNTTHLELYNFFANLPPK